MIIARSTSSDNNYFSIYPNIPTVGIMCPKWGLLFIHLSCFLSFNTLQNNESREANKIKRLPKVQIERACFSPLVLVVQLGDAQPEMDRRRVAWI